MAEHVVTMILGEGADPEICEAAQEDLGLEILDVDWAADLKPNEFSPRRRSLQWILTLQQEEFLGDRFSTKLEDPLTGRKIRL